MRATVRETEWERNRRKDIGCELFSRVIITLCCVSCQKVWWSSYFDCLFVFAAVANENKINTKRARIYSPCRHRTFLFIVMCDESKRKENKPKRKSEKTWHHFTIKNIYCMLHSFRFIWYCSPQSRFYILQKYNTALNVRIDYVCLYCAIHE